MLRNGSRRSLWLVVVTAAAALAPAISAAQRDIGYLAPPASPASAFPRPERPVAAIVSPRRSTEAKRDANNEVGQLARLLALKPGMTVGDIGAGAGYHTVRLARVVGRSGAIIAQDVRPDYLANLARRVQRLGLVNVKLALGEAHDPRLPRGVLDAALLVHMYHEVAEPYAFLYNLAPALKAGARIGIVDLDRPISEHGTPLRVLRCELAAVGYREAGLHTLTGDAGYLAIFLPPLQRPEPARIVPCAR
jgi:SAM-dependent methyltransferase